MTPHLRGTVVPASRKLARASFRKSASALLLMSASVLAGCSIRSSRRRFRYDDDAEPAVQLADPPAPVEVVELPKLLPLPGQLKPLHGGKSHAGAGRSAAARQPGQCRCPRPADPQWLHQRRSGLSVSPVVRSIRSIPRRARSPTLRSRKASSSSAPVRSPPATPCAGSSAIPRAERAPPKSVHILVKPTRPDLVSNLVINTDRRTYLLELRSAEKDLHGLGLLAVSRRSADRVASSERRRLRLRRRLTTGVDISRLRFRYAIEGDNPPWRPLSAFDDGSKVYIEMPAALRKAKRRRCSSSDPKATVNSSIIACGRTTTSSTGCSARPSCAWAASISRPFVSAAPTGGCGERRATRGRGTRSNQAGQRPRRARCDFGRRDRA